MELSKGYEPKAAEKKWYQFWLDRNLFSPEFTPEHAPKREKTFTIVIPPPNVTGLLHQGHALSYTIEDVLVRWKRMSGFKTLWLPGKDHAGIATQNVVEKELSNEGTDRHKLGREKFEERLWQWVKQYSSRIEEQLRAFGCSVDWNRDRFTLDEGLSTAVREVFVALYEEGLIYRGEYLVNWCPRCHTAVSDLEVDHENRSSFLWEIKYPLVKNSGEFLTVATTRPETMLGDTALAVHPDDKRYKGFIGKNVLLPLLNRPIPVIADEYVDKEFGAGCLKITPGHDPNDFQIGTRHKLPIISVMSHDGTMNENAGPYKGLDRFKCREKIVEDLKRLDLLGEIKPHILSVGLCQRCSTIIEPTISTQWFMKMESLAKPAIKAVKNGDIKILPSNWEKIYFNWMENIQDWCISRQLWWGHRIPAWYCEECEKITVARSSVKKCPECQSTSLKQDPDVLDTWFSSALWPFSTLGWPKKTKDLEEFYPTSVMETGYDIIFFWVARMIMMGLKFTGKIPFSYVYLHGMVRDEKGQKMSKSKGNVIDPLDSINEFGADALRFTLISLGGPGKDLKLSNERIQGYRYFLNKIWNAARFLHMNLEGFDPKRHPQPRRSPQPKAWGAGVSTGRSPTLVSLAGDDYKCEGSLADKWIRSRYNQVIESVTKALEEFRLNDAADQLYHFTWHEFCDWYLELSKLSLQGSPESRMVTQKTFFEVYEGTLRLLHPIIPFITEEIWQSLPQREGISISVATFPIPEPKAIDKNALTDMSHIQTVTNAIRTIRGEHRIPPATRLSVSISAPTAVLKLFEKEEAGIIMLARLKELKLKSELAPIPHSATDAFGEVEIQIPLEGVINFDEEKKRLEKEIKKCESDLSRAEAKLSSEKFMKGAPTEIIEQEKGRQTELSETLQKLNRALKRVIG